ncbi:MAG: 3-deoxy-D-manno-octulosonic acid transferase [Terriglobales bacterium]
MYLIYSALLTLALILALPWWVWQMARSGKYRAGLGERFGLVPERLRGAEKRPTIWVHAVSVGELLAIGGLIQLLREQNPKYRIVISTTTATGQKLAREKYGEADVFYFPLDFGFAIRPYFKALRPELVVVAETEFWPNFFRLARSFGARVVVVNARISDRSFPRYRRLKSLLGPVLKSVDCFLTQSDVDRGRLTEIGAPPERVLVSGNLKFDIRPPRVSALIGQLQVAIKSSQANPVIVAGSTVEGEEPLVLEAFRRVLKWYPNAALIVAPRHPERWPAVVELLRVSGLPWWRRTEWSTDTPIAGGIFLLDSIGELAALYHLATVAFVGGSLVPRGGHNILEPAHYGVPIVVGPHNENFRDIVDMFTRAGAVDVIAREKFADEIVHLLDTEQKRTLLGRHAIDVVRANSGATARTADVLAGFLHAPRASRKVRRAP